MADIDLIIDYFRKLERTIMYDNDFAFIDIRLVKKNKIDDLICCILASLPDSYKKMMRQKEGGRFNSIILYNLMFKSIKRKFFLNSGVYLVEADNAKRYIESIIGSIGKDIALIENMQNSWFVYVDFFHLIDVQFSWLS